MFYIIATDKLNKLNEGTKSWEHLEERLVIEGKRSIVSVAVLNGEIVYVTKLERLKPKKHWIDNQ